MEAAEIETDILGAPYERRTIELPDDDEGRVVATLVRRLAEPPRTRAVLYIHGYVDYFFQTHLADYYVDNGWDFYAIDLRKYGRSLLPHQTPNLCRSLDDYRPELDAALKIIREEDGHDRLLVNGHSTGGLIAALWADARPDAAEALFLNSPFFDFNLPPQRRALAATLARLSRSRPRATLASGLGDIYGRSIHSSHHGEWAYDLEWKPLGGYPVAAGYINAVFDGHARLHRGLNVRAPVLVACSTRTFRGKAWDQTAQTGDAVLDVEHIARWAPSVGPLVTVLRLEDGMHDLTLSAPPVRERLFAELSRWLETYLR